MTSTWQPIETAPRGGETFLVWDNECREIKMVWRDQEENEFIEPSGGRMLNQLWLTYWTPLPEPPQ